MVINRLSFIVLCCVSFLFFGLLATASADNATSAVGSAALIVDNVNTGFSSTGAWTTTTLNPGYYGANYLSDGGTGKGSKTAKWLSPVVTAGNYQVQMFFPVADASRSTSVPVTIVPAASTGKKTIMVNEQAAGGTWVSLGSYYFSTTGGQYVQLTNAGTTGTVVADAISWTSVPPGGLPTATPLPINTPVPGTLAKLPFTYSILDATTATYFNQTATPSQVAMVLNDVTPSQVVAAVTTGIPYWGDISWAHAQPQLSGLVSQNHIKGFVYDMEHTITPASEQANAAGTIQTVGLVVHGMGLQFWVTPDVGYASTTIEPMAQSADVIMIQTAHLETSPSAFQAYLVPVIAQAKAANPKVKVYAKVDFVHGTPQQDLAALQAVETSIDGIGVYVRDADLTTNLPTLQSLIAQN